MIRTFVVSIALLFPFSAIAQTNIVDVTPEFVKAGAVIEGLKVIKLSDIVIIRGKTNDPAKAAKTVRIANALGYSRVANLITVRDDATDDAAIEYTAHRRLELEPGLEGCRFKVDSRRGIIHLTGRVQSEMQSDLAFQMLRAIDGVKGIRNELTQ